MARASFLKLAGASTLYAVLLNTPQGKRFATEYTWASVVFGTGLVLASLKEDLSPHDWKTLVQAFGIAGTPMIARSLLNRFVHNTSDS